MTRIIIVRHGETDWNKEKRFMGKNDFSLSDKGKEQACRLAERLEGENIDIIFSSPLRRALETAEEVAKKKGLKVLTEKKLVERNFGILEGITLEEAKKGMGDDFFDKVIDEKFFRIPQGESTYDVEKRVGNFLKDILGWDGDRNFLIVSHGGVGRIMINYLTKEDKLKNKFMTNTGVTIINIKDGKAEVETFNCYKHLKD